MDRVPRSVGIGSPSSAEEGHREGQRDHPLEESQKSYHTILEQQTSRAEEELKRPAVPLFLSGLTAGLDIGFGPFGMVVGATLLRDVVAGPVLDLFTSALYATGFVFVILGHSALFTEHTTSAVLPVLGRRAGVDRLLRLWTIVLAANVLGAGLFAGFGVILGSALEIADGAAFGELAGTMVEKTSGTMLLSAVAAGWLMGLLAWLVTAARDTVGQLLVIVMTTFLIGLAGLHHSIAGTTEVLMGVFAGEGASFGDFGRFLFWSVIGNAIGGSVFVAGLKYAHVRAEQ